MDVVGTRAPNFTADRAITEDNIAGFKVVLQEPSSGTVFTVTFEVGDEGNEISTPSNLPAFSQSLSPLSLWVSQRSANLELSATNTLDARTKSDQARP